MHNQRVINAAMKKIFNWLFPDYKVVQAFGVYGYHSYEILYSKNLDNYKIKCTGFRPKTDPVYWDKVVPAFVQLIENQNKIHENL